MIYTLNNPSKMGIYHNTARKSIDSIKAELGATFICNLNLFDMAKWQGCCFTKADGKVVGTDGYVYDVLAWSSGGKMVKAKSNGAYANAFGCLPIIENGAYCVKSVPAWASGSRQRTAIGIKRDGTPVIYCDTAAKTVAQVANALIKEGVWYAINVDGGASTQCRSDKGNVYGGRVVHTLFYATEDKPKSDCPYKEPTGYIMRGVNGEGSKWVQWHLNQHGAKLVVDGIFGSASDTALRTFQRNNKLTVDGVCGQATRAALKGNTNSTPAAVTPSKKDLESQRDAIVAYCEKQVGSLYVYGAQGQTTESTIDWSAKCFPGYTTATRAARMKKFLADNKKLSNGEPVRMHDCSGLIWAGIDAAGFDVVTGKTIKDSTAADLYKTYCVPIKKTELKPGDLVFTAGLDHVAIVGKNGHIIECAGSDVGCVMNNTVDDRKVRSIYYPKYSSQEYYNKNPWTLFGRFKRFKEAGM